MSNKCAVLLVRVSTSEQDLKPQINDLKKYAKSKGFNQFKVIETKESGLLDLNKREGANELFKFIKENEKYKVVFSTEISRLGRRQSVLHTIKEWFEKNKIQLYVKDTGYSLLDENLKITIEGETMFTLYGLFSENEIKQKKERFSRAKKDLMQLGFSISGKTLFGYKRVYVKSNKRTTLVEDEKNSEIVKTIFNWYINGFDINNKKVSIKKIVMECIKRGFPEYTHSKRNVNKLLKEEAYLGEKITNNKWRNPNYSGEMGEEEYFTSNNRIKYPKIIEKETFIKVQDLLNQNNSRVDKSNKHITILSKLITCNSCNNFYIANYRTRNKNVLDIYRCGSRSSIKGCENKQSISMNMIDSAVWNLIKSDLKTLTKTIHVHNPDKNIANLKTSKLNLEQRLKEAKESISSFNQYISQANMFSKSSSTETISIFMSKIAKLDKEKIYLESELYKIDSELEINSVDSPNYYEIINNNIDAIEKSKELLKKYINLYVEEIRVLSHNSRFSILKIKFKIYGKYRVVESISNRSRIIEDAELDKYVFLILDKRNPNNILCYKTSDFLEIIDDETIKIKVEDDDKSDVTKINISDLLPAKKSKHIKSVNFIKLTAN